MSHKVGRRPFINERKKEKERESSKATKEDGKAEETKEKRRRGKEVRLSSNVAAWWQAQIATNEQRWLMV